MRMPLTSSTRADVKSVVFSFYGCRILFVVGSNCFQDRCAVCHIFCYRSDLIQRRTICDQSVTGNGSVRRFDTGYSTERTRLTDGSAGIRSKCKGTFPAATAAQEPPEDPPGTCSGIPWIFCLAVSRSLCRTSHGKFIHICLSNDDCSGFFQIFDCFRRISRFESYIKSLKLQVVSSPSVHILSLMATGTPASGPVSSPASILCLYFFCAGSAHLPHRSVTKLCTCSSFARTVYPTLP